MRLPYCVELYFLLFIKKNVNLPRNFLNMNHFRLYIALAMIVVLTGCRKDPVKDPEYQGCVVTTTYNDPSFTVAPDGITATFGYTGAAVATLNYLAGNKPSTEEQKFDMNASSVAKRGAIVSQPFEIGEVLDAQPTRVVSGKKPTAASYEETVTYSFNNGKVVVPFTITSDSIFVTVKGEKKALVFGHGDVKFASKELGAPESIEKDGQKYQSQVLTLKMTFTHPQKNASQPFPDIVITLLTKEEDIPVTLIRTENRNHDFSLENVAKPSYFDTFYDEFSIWSDGSETSEKKTDRGTITWDLATNFEIAVNETQFNSVAVVSPIVTGNSITVGSNLKTMQSAVAVGAVGSEFTSKPVFTLAQTANSITNAADEGKTKVKVNSTTVTASCGSFVYTHQASVTFKYTPEEQKITFVGAELKSFNWSQPTVDVVGVMLPGSGSPWDPGSYAKASYTGSAVLMLKFSDNSTKDSTVNVSASTVAKQEKYFPFNPNFGTLFVEYPIENTPRTAVVVDQAKTATTYTETVQFQFGNGEFFLEYSIANSIVSVLVRGEQVPIPFGNGILEMTKVEKTYVSSTSRDGKDYRVYNIYPTLVFKHPEGNLSQEFPRHGYQIAEPRP